AITINNPPTISKPVVTDVDCNGAFTGKIHIVVTGSSPFTYAWSSNHGFSSSEEDIENIPAGTYSLTVTDHIGCKSTLIDVVVGEPNLLTSVPTVSNNVSCNGGSNGKGYITANGGTAPYQYLWSNTANTDTISGLVAGKYYVTITDHNLCTKIDSISITQPDALTITVDSTRNISCNGTSTGG
ncbi:MAG TPA: SprB repeat-containing protein, partial [Bacteroidales bacterium]|nr:SprB repeat-containing protein [Bacteroidales bacterium]